MKKIIFATLVVVSFVFASVIAVDAACNRSGKITSIRIEGTTSSPFAIVYIRPVTSASNTSYCYWYRVNRGGVISVLAAAFAANHTVYIVGNVSSCPTKGSSRYGGYITRAYVYNTR